MVPDRRSFHQSKFAHFGDPDGSTVQHNPNGNSTSSLRITIVLPLTIVEYININPVIGLICVNGSDNDDGAKRRRRQQLQWQEEDGGKAAMSTIPWMCLYTCTSAFLLSIGYQNNDNCNQYDQPQQLNGKIVHTHGTFKKQLLTSLVDCPYCPAGSDMHLHVSTV